METRTSERWLWVVLAVVLGIGLLAILAALSMPSSGYYGMMGGGGWGWALLMMGVPFVILIVILFVAFVGLREPAALAAYPIYGPPALGPLDVLDQRYARGELNREEYLRIRQDLSRASARP
ncbi:MAG TPA: SHOCT domain-containing protein [Thermoplasmata archaeon]